MCIALDDRAVYLSRWHRLLEKVTADAESAAWADAKAIASLLDRLAAQRPKMLRIGGFENSGLAFMI